MKNYYFKILNNSKESTYNKEYSLKRLIKDHLDPENLKKIIKVSKDKDPKVRALTYEWLYKYFLKSNDPFILGFFETRLDLENEEMKEKIASILKKINRN